MLDIATVFSGIGAFEHALERMGVPHNVRFACDNSGIDWAEKFPTSTKKLINFLQNISHHKDSGDGSFSSTFCCRTCGDSETEIGFTPLISLDSCLEHMRSDFPNLKESLISKKAKEKFQRYDNYTVKCMNCKENMLESHETLESLIKNNLKSISSNKTRSILVNELYALRNKKHFVKESYLANYDVNIDEFFLDIEFLTGEEYQDAIDILVGGSPCQSFSHVGRQGGFDDARGTLFYEFIRLVQEIKPKMFVWENVRGVYTHDGGNTWEIIKQCFDELGYVWSHQVLDSKNFGIPQHRQRVFVVGFLDQEASFTFPEQIELQHSMQDFLEDKVEEKYYLGKKGIDFVTRDSNHKKQYTQINGDVMLCQKANQQYNWHGDFVLVKPNISKEIDDKYFLSEKVKDYVMSEGTKNFSTKVEIDLPIARPLLSTLFKNHRAGIDNYITSDSRIRQLTPRECLRLMGFCDSFKIVVSDVQIYKQAGNSIVVDVLIAILAKAIPILVNNKQTMQLLIERAKNVEELFSGMQSFQIKKSELKEIVKMLE